MFIINVNPDFVVYKLNVDANGSKAHKKALIIV
jgi:hypothetical protein